MTDKHAAEYSKYAYLGVILYIARSISLLDKISIVLATCNTKFKYILHEESRDYSDPNLICNNVCDITLHVSSVYESFPL